MDQRVSDADSELTYIKDSLATMDLRLQTKEDLLRKQFTAMEQAIAASQSASSSLAGQLAQLQQRLTCGLKLRWRRAITGKQSIRLPLPELR